MSTSLEDALNGNVSEAEEPNAPEMEAEASAEQSVEVEATQETVDAGEQPEPEQPEAPEQSAQPRDKKGKFAKKSEKVEAESAQEAAQQPQADEAMRQELEQLRREREQWQQAQRAQQEAQAMPDPIDDPKAYARMMEQRFEAASFQNKLQLSEAMARREHGNDVWEAANAWLAQNPQEAQRCAGELDPCGAAIRAHKRHLAMQEIGDDPQAYRERLEAEIRERLQAEMQTTTPEPKTMPANFASSRNAGARRGPDWAGPTPLEDALRR